MYCTQQDMAASFGENELIRLTDRENEGTVNTTVLNRAIAAATGEINDHLRVRYPLPLLTVPAAITQIACDIARYYLYDDHATEQVRLRYKDAVRRLAAYAAGTEDPGIPVAGSNAPDTDTAMGFGGRSDWRGGSF